MPCKPPGTTRGRGQASIGHPEGCPTGLPLVAHPPISFREVDGDKPGYVVSDQGSFKQWEPETRTEGTINPPKAFAFILADSGLSVTSNETASGM
jgi:hypothetical protein